MLTVLFFAYLKDLIQDGKVTLGYVDGMKVRDLTSLLEIQYDVAGKLQNAIKSVNRQFAGDEQILQDGDEVAYFPPVSGGAHLPPIILVSTDPITADEVIKTLSTSTTGAISSFSGVVRENTVREHLITPALFYEAYEEMACEKMREIAEELHSRWPAIERVAMIQRIGYVKAGETSTFIACSSSHRDSGIFEATFFAIQRLKEIVPVWKKEISESGEAWVQGDYYPRPGE